ncbi:MAG: molybdate ABC transporter substrate-binding protein [Deltaproteobacteria bacterium]|nr:molybdate ABC transporter substrate-binding protein [Deltaproteobacteria bacterium]
MRRIWLAALISLSLSACGDARSAGEAPAEAASAPDLGAHRVDVCATASLRSAFEAIARAYEAQHAGAEVALRFAGSAELLAALNAGEPCDVVAFADSSAMSRAVGAGQIAVGSPAELARNRIAIAVARGNPKGIAHVSDLARPGVRVALGAKSASIGHHARWVLSRAKVAVKPVAEVATADEVYARVASGEADAGIVYTTTFLGAEPALERVDLPAEENTPALYSIAVVREPREKLGAEAFRAFALAAEGQRLLGEAGFLPIGAKRD